MRDLFKDYDFEGMNLARQYRSTIHRIDAYDVLTRYGAENVTLMNSSRGEQLQHSCIIDKVDPHHTHGDSNPSASLHVDKKLYHCHSYGGGDLFWLLQIMEQTDRLGIYSALSELVGEMVSTEEDFKDEVEKLLSEASPEEPIPHYAKRILDPWLVHHPYMRGRGISKDVLEDHYVGYDPDEVKIVLPHFWNGRLVGWQKRVLTDPQFPTTPLIRGDDGRTRVSPKYVNTFGFPKDRTFYTSTELTSDDFEASSGGSVLVLESVASVLRAETLARSGKLLEAHAEVLGRCVATFGAKVSDRQIEMLRGFESVILWFDDDFAGKVAAKKLSRRLSKFARVKVVDESKFDGDLADLEPSQVAYALENAEHSVMADFRIDSQIEEIKKEMSRK